MDANTENRFFGAAKRDVVGGLQFQFDLPYKGYFNVAPLVYWEFFNHNSFAQCASGFSGPIPGVSCLSDGNTSFKPTWAVETNYYMDLGGLPLLAEQVRPRSQPGLCLHCRCGRRHREQRLLHRIVRLCWRHGEILTT